MRALAAWNAYFTTMGTAAATLAGLTFVVISLVKDERRAGSHDGVATFTTPTIVHFSTVLFASALMLVPFASFVPIAILLGCAGLVGLAYTVRTAILSTRLEQYEPDAEDWIFHVALPFVAYATFVGGAFAMRAAPAHALFAPAAAAAILTLTAIHNAWDVVTFLTIDDSATASETED